METELQQFSQERSERVRLLREKHERQLESFDIESASMGFRWDTPFDLFEPQLNSLFKFIFSALALAEATRETYPEDTLEGSLSGSMLSLAHSNSSTSFPAGSL